MNYPRLKDFMVSSLIFEIKFSQNHVFESYPGHLFRSVIGKSLHDLSCLKPKNTCDICNLSQSCPYSILHEAPFNKDIELDFSMSKTNYPKPLIITPDISAPFKVLEDELLGIEIVFIGKSAAFFKEVVHAFSMAGKNGIDKNRVTFEIVRIKDSVNNTVVFEDGIFITEKIPCFYLDYSEKEKNEKAMLLFRFKTPLRLQKNGEIIKNIEFLDIWKSLVKRISVLAAIYGGTIENKEFIPETFKIAENITVVSNDLTFFKHSRYSTTQSKSLPLDGMRGEIVFSDVDRRFLPILKMGEFIHIGKGLTSGLGSYSLYMREM